MKSQQDLRKRLSHLLVHAADRKESSNIIANMLLNEIDNLMLVYWGHLSDMGMPRKEFEVIRRKVKKHLVPSR